MAQYKGPPRGHQGMRWRSWVPMIIGGLLLAGLVASEVGPPLVGYKI
jgi:hypothetical protein